MATPAARPLERPHRANPLYVSDLLAQQQPAGGYGKICLRVRPVPAVAVPDLMRPDVFDRRPGVVWQLTNEGSVAAFSATIPPSFGVAAGDRVLATWGPTAGRCATVVGMRRGCLWVRDDGAFGATALAGLDGPAAREAMGWAWHGSERLVPLTHLSIPVLPAGGDDNNRGPRPRRLACDPDTMACAFGPGCFHGTIMRQRRDALKPTSVLLHDPANPRRELLVVPAGVDSETGELCAFFVDPAACVGGAVSSVAAWVDAPHGPSVLFAQVLHQCRCAADVEAAYGLALCTAADTPAADVKILSHDARAIAHGDGHNRLGTACLEWLPR